MTITTVGAPSPTERAEAAKARLGELINRVESLQAQAGPCRVATLPINLGSATYRPGSVSDFPLGYRVASDPEVGTHRPIGLRILGIQIPGLDDTFTPEIRTELPPDRFKMASCETYSGTSGPFDHVQTFKMVMSRCGANDTILCKAFPTTLRGAARSWYNSLPGNSVGSFP